MAKALSSKRNKNVEFGRLVQDIKECRAKLDVLSKRLKILLGDLGAGGQMNFVKATFIDTDGCETCIYGTTVKAVEKIIRDGLNLHTRAWREECGLEFELLQFEATKKDILKALRMGYQDGYDHG